MNTGETAPELDLLVPGQLHQRTGGYLYDARMVEGLRARGWAVRVHELEGRFPDPDDLALDAIRGVAAGTPTTARVLVDGLALPALAAARMPVSSPLALVHHPVADETGLDEAVRDRMSALEREALRGCSGLIVTSAFTAARLSEGFGVPGARIRVVVPGTEIGGAGGRADPEGDEHPPRLLCVGSVTPRKGQDVLVAALARIRELDWECTLAGSLDRDPEYARRVESAVRTHDLDGRVKLVGELGQEALGQCYHGASIFVLPSYYEGYGMALAEALAHGLPVVSTTGGAIPHTVPDDAGILVEPGDVGGLARALGTLLRNPDARDRARAAATRHGAQLPDWNEAVDAFAGALLDFRPETSARGA